jgi:hypothetical protein
MNKQINVSIPKEWFEQLERLARLYSVEEDRTLTHLDLIRNALKEKYNLVEEEGEQGQV